VFAWSASTEASNPSAMYVLGSAQHIGSNSSATCPHVVFLRGNNNFLKFINDDDDDDDDDSSNFSFIFQIKSMVVFQYEE